jgi:hypothetical protein
MFTVVLAVPAVILAIAGIPYWWLPLMVGLILDL